MLATEVEEPSLLASILQKRMRDNALDEQESGLMGSVSSDYK